MKITKEPIRKQIFIRKDILLSRIKLQANVVAKARSTNGVNDTAMNAISQYEPLLIDMITKYLHKAEGRMAAYVEKPKTFSQMEYAKNWEERVIHLVFPYYWEETTFENLSVAINEYIVNSALAEYFSLIYTSKDAVVADRQFLADEAYDDIKHYCLTSKPHSIKKVLKPF